MNKEQLILLLGEEEYLRNKNLTGLVRDLLPEADQDFNYQLFYGDGLSADVFVNAASTWPFGGDKRVVVVKNLDDCDADFNEKVLRFLENGPSFLWLILTAKKMPEKNKLYQFLKKNATIISCAPWPEGKKIAWLTEEGNNLGLNLTPEMVRYILHESSSSLLALSNQLQKLYLYQEAKGAKITMDDLRLMIHGENTESIFALSDLVAKKKTTEVFHILEHLYRQGEAEVNIIGLLGKQYRQMLAAKAAMQEGRNELYLAQQLGIHPYAAKIACSQSKLFSMAELIEGLQKIAAYDEEIKTGRCNARQGLNLLLLELLKRNGGSTVKQ